MWRHDIKTQGAGKRLRNDPRVMKGDHTAILDGSEKQLVMGATALEQAVLLGRLGVVHLPPDLMAIMRCQPFQSRSGDDRCPVRVMKPQPGLQNVL